MKKSGMYKLNNFKIFAKDSYINSDSISLLFPPIDVLTWKLLNLQGLVSRNYRIQIQTKVLELYPFLVQNTCNTLQLINKRVTTKSYRTLEQNLALINRLWVTGPRFLRRCENESCKVNMHDELFTSLHEPWSFINLLPAEVVYSPFTGVLSSKKLRISASWCE